ncbi:hypothetical protein Y1Q_0024632 [Alligator mississippiensis]|uniref:Uncharacterized protein n=1 Tax=Alligator mississippiensis TaxID=8496 RepID=A0A151NB75_ALLMI|nr:hypothetical protein Y1Q_0024632 [Alligator mississippiensis]
MPHVKLMLQQGKTVVQQRRSASVTFLDVNDKRQNGVKKGKQIYFSGDPDSHLPCLAICYQKTPRQASKSEFILIGGVGPFLPSMISLPMDHPG